MPNKEKIENLLMKIVFKQKLTFEEATASFVCMEPNMENMICKLHKENAIVGISF